MEYIAFDRLWESENLCICFVCCFLSSKKIQPTNAQPTNKLAAEGMQRAKGARIPCEDHSFCPYLSRLGTWSQGSCQQLLRIMSSVFQDRPTSKEQVFNQSSIWSLHYSKLMVKSLFSPLINDVILKLGKMSSAAVIAGNSGFSSKNWNSRSNNFHRQGP